MSNLAFSAYSYKAPVLDRFRNRKAVFYGRVSTQHEEQLAALGNQMQWYDDQAKYHPNWTIVDRYIDEGITGTLAKKRPSFMRMIEDAQKGRFDLIVTREVCRFARNTVDTLVVTRSLKEYGVEVFFVEDNIWTMDGDGELRLTIMATLAQEESRKISERVRAGQAISRENGVLYGNGNIIGYDLVNGNYVINEEQANTIRMVYELYSLGYGEKRICNELTVSGCKDGNGNVKWSCVKISRILRNATYKGYICYNKSTTNNYLDKRRIKNLDEDSIVLVKGSFEPIVSEDLWERCRQIRLSRIKEYRISDSETKRRCSNPPRGLWTKKLCCRCGGNFRKAKWRINQITDQPVFAYECNRRKRNATKSFIEEHNASVPEACDMISFPEWKLELMAQQVFRRVWGDQKEAILLACDMLSKCGSFQPSGVQMKAVKLSQQIEKLQSRLKNYSAMRADGELSKEEYLSFSSETNAEINELTAELRALERNEPQVSSLDLDKIRAALNHMVDLSKPKIADELIEEFVDTITPVENYRFRWKLNFDHSYNPCHADLMAITADPILTFTIDFETAKQYRESRHMDHRFRKTQWNDLVIEVYL